MTSPTARTKVTSSSKQVSRLRLYAFGEDDRVPNEGDLLIVSETFVREANNQQDIEFEILLRGSDMIHMKKAVDAAVATYEANKEYLRQPASQVVAKRSQRLDPVAILDGLRSHG